MKQLYATMSLAFVLTGVTQAQEIAYVEKVYSSDGALPLRQIFLVNGDGTARRQVTFNKANHPGFMWLDANNFAYVEMANERVISKATSERHIFDAVIYRYNVPSRTSKALGSIKNVLSLGAISGRQFQFYTTTNPKAVTASNTSISVSNIRSMAPTYNVQPTASLVTEEPARTGFLTTDIRTRWGLMRIYRPDGNLRPLNRTEPFGFEIYDSGYVQTAQLLGPVLNDARIGTDGALYLVTMARGSKFAELFLYRMASPRSAPTLIVRQIEPYFWTTSHPVWISGRPGIW
ncbi:MAG TPA: hypothetical protein VK171_02295 [Fimbriimonas sp.]|nr:hypothetical protein [Fimbriimonas sp.]